MQQEPLNDEAQILDRMPMVSEYVRRIDRINNAIETGAPGGGIDEALDLISDLPTSWQEEISDKSLKLKQLHDNITAPLKLKTQKHNGLQQSIKEDAQAELDAENRVYARKLKTIVIDILHEKDMLFLTRRKVETSPGFSQIDEEEAEKNGF